MGIIFHSDSGVFHLSNGKVSYIIKIFRDKYPVNLYWGKAIKQITTGHFFELQEESYDAYRGTLDVLPVEYPAYGNTDFHSPAYQVQLPDGSTVSDLQYRSHKIYSGKPSLKGLPATYVEDKNEAETLELILWDNISELEVVLLYTIYNEHKAITRSVRFINQSKQSIKLLRSLSMSINFLPGQYDWLHLPGAWGRERCLERFPLYTGCQSIESRRGSSSHQQNPFLAILEKNATEHTGQVYGFSLVYSGNFLGHIEVDHNQVIRINMGINPFDFSWLLEAKEEFQAPEVVMVYSDTGLNGMSQSYHSLYASRLCRGKYRDKKRPILVNNWEATYFDFNMEKLLQIADEAKTLGLDLFVLDDGWFGKRNDDSSSLGDWFVNEKKLPGGLKRLSEELSKRQLKLGLWFEPEMISPDSDLYRSHPDWCIHIPQRPRSEMRRQLILDLTQEHVRDEIYKRISNILESAPIQYVKWDMNRQMTETGSAFLPPERQRETAHRYMLGVYDLMDKITRRFPDILFESCAGGGGRFDPGMLYYMPQTWTSDNTDAIARLRIQYGTSIVYPPITMGAHVSTVPNHQVQRITSLEIRGHVAMSGNLGYELDLTTLGDADKDLIKEQVEFYHTIQHLIQSGRFYRLRSPFEGNIASWMFVSPDQDEALIFWGHILAPAHRVMEKLRLKGLRPDYQYTRKQDNKVYSGEELMYYGIQIPVLEGDFRSLLWHFTRNTNN